MSQLTRHVWYQLVESDGQPYEGSDVDFVLLSSGSLIAELTHAVHEVSPMIPIHIGRSQLRVYENESALNREEAIDPGSSLCSLGGLRDEPLIVAVPVTSRKGTWYLFFENVEIPEAVQEYDKLAKRIQSDEKADKYITALYKEFTKKELDGPFHALCVPSGTGKTQLAFALPRDKCGCIYLNMALEVEDDPKQQHVYKGFTRYMRDFIQWLKVDYTTWTKQEKFEAKERLKENAVKSPPQELWIYGFIAALIKLLNDNPELNLPTDLSRLRIDQSRPDSFVKNQIIAPVSRVKLESVIRQWPVAAKKDIIFFIDEFAPTLELIQEHLAFLRRMLMNTGQSVIVASTDSGAMNMYKKAPASYARREGAKAPWVKLYTQLPGYVAPPEVVSAINGWQKPAEREVLKLCIESRPLFAAAVVESIDDYVNGRSEASIVELIENIREKVAGAMKYKKQAYSEEGCYGNIVAMLLGGGPLVTQIDHLKDVFSHFSNKHWAYLVSDEDVLRKLVAAPNIPKEQGTVMGHANDHYLSIRKDGAQLLTLYRREDLLVLDKPEEGGPQFSCITFFPHPKEDFLLYLALTGSKVTKSKGAESKDEYGLFLLTSDNVRHRISVAQLAEKVVLKQRSMPISQNAISPHDKYHEGVVCAAFYTACNAGSITGCSLEELITRFVAELIVTSNSSYPELTKVDPIEWKSSKDFRANFLLPFDTKLPAKVCKVLLLAQSSRPKNSESVDAVTSDAHLSVPSEKLCTQLKPYKIMVEAKSTVDSAYVEAITKAALKNQDTKAAVSFIVVNKEPAGEFTIGPDDIVWKDREMRVAKKFPPGDPVNARVYLVELVDVENSKKVALKRIDVLPENGKEIEQLIFVISQDLVQKQFCTNPGNTEAVITKPKAKQARRATSRTKPGKTDAVIAKPKAKQARRATAKTKPEKKN